MKLLLLGSGGREHALAWKIAQSPKIEKLYIAPGNAGTSNVGENVAIKADDFTAIREFVVKNNIDMVVVGPEDPLVKGIYDYFKKDEALKNIPVIGPSKAGAVLEGSKEFAKGFMQRHNIPTAGYKSITAANLEEGLAFLETLEAPYVLKADGLCAGKGVLILPTLEEAKEELKKMLSGMFGNASATVVIEEFLSGIECSVFVLTDGKNYKILPEAKDYKRIGEGDKGLNTGGMGTFSPSPFYTEEVDAFSKKYIYQATVDAMAAEGRPFKGVIFFGLMLTPNGPKVLEYNARFGDPEAQVVLPRMKNDIIEVMEACVDGTLDQIDLQFEDNAAVCVVLASDGYPVSYEKGYVINGLEKFNGKDGYYCFHAGTKLTDKGIVTNGGRVLGVTAKGATLKEARANAYAATEWITFENKYMRHDIGKAIDEA
jgi:phosphoribosylamine--glycine ligase